jgi:hypothetical protein
MRSVLFGENIKKLLNVDDAGLFSLDTLNTKRAEIIGEEKIFTRFIFFQNFKIGHVRIIDDFRK